MRKVLLTLTLSFFFFSLFSQDSLLKKFKFRDVSYRAINLALNGSAGYDNTDYAAGKSKSSNGSGTTGADYYFIKSTDKILLNASAGLNVSYSTNKAENISSSEYKSRSLYFTPGFSIVNKWFSGKSFVELGADANVGLSSFKDTYTNPSNTIKSSRQDYSLSVIAGIGKGRLENITDMQNALWLHDALAKEGRLTRLLSPEELNGLGHAIIKARNTRVLDYRKRTQFILETVDDYLQKKDLISQTDIRYFSDLNDIIFFALNDPRLSGTEKYIRLMPSIAYMDHKQSDKLSAFDNNDKATEKSIRLSAGIKKYMPFNLHHQNNYGIGVYADYIENNGDQKFFVSGVLANERNISPILRRGGVNLFFEHAIYTNTRTVISFIIQTEGGYQKADEETSGYGSADISGWLNYFVSYHTRLTASIGLNYQNNMYSQYNSYLQLVPDRIRIYANAGIQVSL